MIQRLTIPGVAVAWQRPQFGRTKGGKTYTYTPNKTKQFEREVGKEANRAGVRQHTGIVAMEIRFFGCTGDADNLSKSILDGLIGFAYNDDRQVEELHVYVDRKGKPARTEIEIRTKGDTGAELLGHIARLSPRLDCAGYSLAADALRSVAAQLEEQVLGEGPTQEVPA